MKKPQKLITSTNLRITISIILFSSFYFCASGQSFLLSGNQPSALLKEYSSARIGLGTGSTLPTAIFHVLSNNGILSDPLFRVESKRTFDPEASVSFLGSRNISGIQKNYAIYQEGEAFLNYFEGPVIINDWLYYGHNSTHINGILVLNQCLDDQLQFKFQTPNSNNDWDTPLILDATDGVITHGILSCDRFKMSTGAANNAVLVSDIEGNASWAEVV